MPTEVSIAQQLWTADEFLSWLEPGVFADLIDGQIIMHSPVSLLHGVSYIWERDLHAELGAVQAPTLLVWGERDRLVPARVAEEWQRLLPRSRLVLVQGGHVPMWEAPGELADCILAFLDDELPDDAAEEDGLRVRDRVGLAGQHDKSAPR